MLLFISCQELDKENSQRNNEISTNDIWGVIESSLESKIEENYSNETERGIYRMGIDTILRPDINGDGVEDYFYFSRRRPRI